MRITPITFGAGAIFYPLRARLDGRTIKFWEALDWPWAKSMALWRALTK